jgi:hypothetical protein
MFHAAIIYILLEKRSNPKFEQGVKIKDVFLNVENICPKTKQNKLMCYINHIVSVLYIHIG